MLVVSTPARPMRISYASTIAIDHVCGQMSTIDMMLIATYLSLLLARLTSGHMMCQICIPLEDLLAPGYGISVSVDGLSSAAAYHNGTMVTLASTNGSEEYRNLMSSTLRQYDTYKPRSTTLTCSARPWKADPVPFDKDIAKLIYLYADKLIRKMRSAPNPSKASDIVTPLDPTTQLIQAQLLALQPFANMTAESRSRIAVTIQIPAWLIASPHACSFRQATEATFGRVVRLESASSSAYTALGYELCRVSQDAYNCDGPGRLAVFEYDGHLATASMIKTPLDIFDRLETKYSTLTSHKSVELSKWMNSFLDACSPDMISLAGSGVDYSTFQDALNLSNAAGKVESIALSEAEDLLVKGAAQIAKDALENHSTDCDEHRECLEIRRQSDVIAGKYRFRRPEVWPAVNNRHWQLSSDVGYMVTDYADHYVNKTYL